MQGKQTTYLTSFLTLEARMERNPTNRSVDMTNHLPSSPCYDLLDELDRGLTDCDGLSQGGTAQCADSAYEMLWSAEE